MYKLVICDDDEKICEELEKICDAYAEERTLEMQTETFLSGSEFLSEMEVGRVLKPTILFLDIEFPEGKNGVETGRILREKLFEEGVFIVYISSKTSYAMELFQNRPFDFLVKPLKKERVFDVLDRIFRVMGVQTGFFEFFSKGMYTRIPYRDIFYFFSEGKKIHIVTKTGIQTFYGKLKEAAEALSKKQFLSIHKSYLINRNYVAEYTYETVRMTNGDILNISKPNRPEVRRQILQREGELRA